MQRIYKLAFASLIDLICHQDEPKTRLQGLATSLREQWSLCSAHSSGLTHWSSDKWVLHWDSHCSEVVLPGLKELMFSVEL